MKTKKLVLTALFTALILCATLLIQIPLPFGYVHLGDGFVLLSTFILGPFLGSVASGLGSALADLFSGYALYAPATFLIKFSMALFCWFTHKLLSKFCKKPLAVEIFACLIGAFIMAFGYCLYESIIFSPASAVANVLWNLLQGSAGVVVSVTLLRFPIPKYK